MMIVLLLWPQMGLFFIHVSGNVFVDDVAKKNSHLKYLSCMVLIAHLAALGSNSSWNVSWLLISSWLAVTSTPAENII